MLNPYQMLAKTHGLTQRPSARDLLKHKFVRLAKKTNYLTELIERHERWRAEGGERIEQEELNAEDLCVPNLEPARYFSAISLDLHPLIQRICGTSAPFVMSGALGQLAAPTRTQCRCRDRL